MRIRLLSVGKPGDPQADALVERYAARIVRFGVGLETEWVAEVRAGGRFSADHAREREARQLVERLGKTGRTIAVERRGFVLTSAELARRLEGWATPRATFVIGGPLGLHPSVAERADGSWSLSSLTFPHELARVIVAEQLYRALTLLRGVPYHK